MKIFNKKTNDEILIPNRRAFAQYVYTDINFMYGFISPILAEISERYKDEELREHLITAVESRKIMENPDYIHDIPKMEVSGYDEEVSATRLDRQIGEEAYNAFLNNDTKLLNLINKCHPTVKATL